MNIEITEFYLTYFENENEFLKGSLTITIVDLEIKLLGIFVQRKKGVWWFSLPFRFENDHRRPGFKVRYPLIVFENIETNRRLMDALHQLAPPFIEGRLASDKLIVIPQRTQQNPADSKETSSSKISGQSKVNHQRMDDNATKTKRTASVEVSDQPTKKRIKIPKALDKTSTKPVVIGKARNHSLYGGNKKNG